MMTDADRIRELEAERDELKTSLANELSKQHDALTKRETDALKIAFDYTLECASTGEAIADLVRIVKQEREQKHVVEAERDEWRDIARNNRKAMEQYQLTANEIISNREAERDAAVAACTVKDDALRGMLLAIKSYGFIENHGHRRPGSACNRCEILNAAEAALTASPGARLSERMRLLDTYVAAEDALLAMEPDDGGEVDQAAFDAAAASVADAREALRKHDEEAKKR